jgi:hypothetical protein
MTFKYGNSRPNILYRLGTVPTANCYLTVSKTSTPNYSVVLLLLIPGCGSNWRGGFSLAGRCYLSNWQKRAVGYPQSTSLSMIDYNLVLGLHLLLHSIPIGTTSCMTKIPMKYQRNMNMFLPLFSTGNGILVIALNKYRAVFMVPRGEGVVQSTVVGIRINKDDRRRCLELSCPTVIQNVHGHRKKNHRKGQFSFSCL